MARTCIFLTFDLLRYDYMFNIVFPHPCILRDYPFTVGQLKYRNKYVDKTTSDNTFIFNLNKFSPSLPLAFKFQLFVQKEGL